MVTILSRVRQFFHGFYNLRWQLFISYLLVGFIPLIIFSFSVSQYMETYFIDKKTSEVKSLANQIATSITSDYINDIVIRKYVEEWTIAPRNVLNYRIIVVDDNAVAVSDTARTDISRIYAYPEVLGALRGKDVSNYVRDEGIINVAVSIFEDEKVIGALLIMAPDTMEIDKALAEINSQLLILPLPMGVIIVAVVFIISRLIIGPMKKMLDVVKRMTTGHLNQRITVRKHGEFAELSEAFNDMSIQLEQVEMTRNEFVSNVSHELKTPLSSMKVLSEALLLQSDVPVVTYREFLIDINSEIDRMTSIVNELLTLVKLDRTENSLNIKPIRVNKVIDDIIRRLSPIASQKDIELTFEDAKPVIVDADEMKLSLAISNLIENAIKYTDSGGYVKVTLSADHQNAFVSISDNGIGIEEENQKKVFARFYRVDKTRDRDTGGTGLGLAITQKTVLLHNGSIKLTSKQGEGSTFLVRLPLRLEQQPEKE